MAAEAALPTPASQSVYMNVTNTCQNIENSHSVFDMRVCAYLWIGGPLLCEITNCRASLISLPLITAKLCKRDAILYVTKPTTSKTRSNKHAITRAHTNVLQNISKAYTDLVVFHH